MKKIIFFFLIIGSLVSCADSDENAPSDVTPLQKVIFNANSSNAVQRHWNFNNSGLLSTITDGNGFLLQTFTYDSNGRVTNSTVYHPNAETRSYNFSYNSEGSVSGLNSEPLNFDTALGAYFFGDLNGSYRLFKLNAEGLLVYEKTGGFEIDETGTIPYTTSETYASYSARNMTGRTFNNGNFHGFEHDNHVNPLRNATLAAFKALAVTDYNEEWLNSFAVSANNVTRKDYPSEYHIHEEFVYDFNADGMPVSATMKFYELNHLDFSIPSILYYYQGDVLP